MVLKSNGELESESEESDAETEIEDGEVGDDGHDESETLKASRAELSLVSRRVLAVYKDEEQIQRENIFHTRCEIQGKICSMIIDGGSCTNVISNVVVDKLGLETIKHPEPYRLQWLNDSGEMKVNKQAKVKFSIDKYVDVVLCDVVPMHASHILLGRPWEFDKDAIHYGRENSIVFKFKGKKFKLEPLTPNEVFKDQLHMQQRREAEKFKEKASMAPMVSPSIQEEKGELAVQGKSSKTQIEWKNHNKAESEKLGTKAESDTNFNESVSEKEKERKEKKKKKIYLSLGDFKKAFVSNKPLLIMIHKDANFKILLLLRTLSTLLRALLSGNLKIWEILFSNYKKCNFCHNNHVFLDFVVIVFDPGDLVWFHLQMERFTDQRKSELTPCVDESFQVLKLNNKSAYKLDLPGECNMSAAFNIADLTPFSAGDDLDLRTNPFQEEGNDVIPPEPVQPTTRWGAEPLRMKVGPITRAQAKKFKENLAVLIQRIIHTQEGLTMTKEPKPVLVIQALEAGTDPGDGFGTNLEIGQHELVPHLYGINSYVK